MASNLGGIEWPPKSRNQSVSPFLVPERLGGPQKLKKGYICKATSELRAAATAQHTNNQ